VERCEQCGFVWAEVPDADITDRIARGAAELADRLLAAPAPGHRPAPDRWSALEYGAHVRDVLLNLRDRVVVTLVEDDPDFKPLYRDKRVELGLYARDDARTVAAELGTAAALFARTWAALDGAQLDRPCRYAFPTLSTRSVRWMGQQVVHEVEHHLDDVRADAG
jgi:hypothetical protein